MLHHVHQVKDEAWAKVTASSKQKRRKEGQAGRDQTTGEEGRRLRRDVVSAATGADDDELFRRKQTHPVKPGKPRHDK